LEFWPLLKRNGFSQSNAVRPGKLSVQTIGVIA
jgi:hypothetical protein